MILRNLSILNFKNIREANLTFADNINCFIGLNGQGKTNLLDAIHYLSFTKSAFNTIDSQNITHNEAFGMIQGTYMQERQTDSEEAEKLTVTCGLRRGQKKQFRVGKKDYSRMHDHIGVIPLVMVSPADQELITAGSDVRRRFLDVVISQYNRQYLNSLTEYQSLLNQRNALLKQCEEQIEKLQVELMDIIEERMAATAIFIHGERQQFVESFIPYFQQIYNTISDGAEPVELIYSSQLHNRDIRESLLMTRQRDVFLGWTSQGIHKDDIEMLCDGYPLKQVASQGQQKTYVLAMKLAQALFLNKREEKLSILLLDDIFDKLDAERVERIVSLVLSDIFGQIFITDTDRQHLSSLLSPHKDAKIFHVTSGTITVI